MGNASGSFTDLYRYYDSDGVLLYIGISLNAAKRASEHRKDKAWWPEVATIQIEHLPTNDRALVLEVEAAAIKAEKPKYNVVHNGWHYTERKCKVGRTWDFRWLRMDAFMDLISTLGSTRETFHQMERDEELHSSITAMLEMTYYPDCCSCCEDGVTYPFRAESKGNWVKMHYVCPRTHAMWSCDWAMEGTVLAQ